MPTPWLQGPGLAQGSGGSRGPEALAGASRHQVLVGAGGRRVRSPKHWWSPQCPRHGRSGRPGAAPALPVPRTRAHRSGHPALRPAPGPASTPGGRGRGQAVPSPRSSEYTRGAGGSQGPVPSARDPAPLNGGPQLGLCLDSWGPCPSSPSGHPRCPSRWPAPATWQGSGCPLRTGPVCREKGVTMHHRARSWGGGGMGRGVLTTASPPAAREQPTARPPMPAPSRRPRSSAAKMVSASWKVPKSSMASACPAWPPTGTCNGTVMGVGGI